MFFQGQRNQYSQQGPAKAQNAVAKPGGFFPIVAAQSGKEQNQGEFCDFRGLKLKPCYIDPTSGPVDLLAHQQNAEQQQNAQPIAGPGQPIPDPCRDSAKAVHGQKPQPGAHRLALQIPGGGGPTGIIGTLGGTGGIQHRKSHRQQQER